MNCRIYKKHDELTRKGRRIQFALNFWTRVAAVTRLGLHGFVLWRIRRAYERAVEFNMIAQAHRRERGDCAKLREALETARLFVTNCPTPLTTPLLGCGMSRAEVINIIDATLAAPPQLRRGLGGGAI